eukprot:GHVL01004794.1.p1 GENE.GHVL01004794.1~~GHVL01004794.1.p1  ORF type:complete len:252 (+),score=31.52 GHVL01004794.1:76-831(+)
MPPLTKTQKKTSYFEKLPRLFQEHPKVLIISINNVGSKQFNNLRVALRGKAIILMGKNTMIRRCMNMNMDNVAAFKTVLPLVRFNIGFIFCIADIAEIQKVIQEYFVPAAARTGAIAPCSVSVPAGPTGLDPAQTSFFQALNISTKIVKGQIEISSNVDLLKEGERVGASQAALLQKLNVMPFQYGILIEHVCDNGSVFSPKVLDLTDNDIVAKFSNGVRNVAALSKQVKPLLNVILLNIYAKLSILFAEQ